MVTPKEVARYMPARMAKYIQLKELVFHKSTIATMTPAKGTTTAVRLASFKESGGRSCSEGGVWSGDLELLCKSVVVGMASFM